MNQRLPQSPLCETYFPFLKNDLIFWQIAGVLLSSPKNMDVEKFEYKWSPLMDKSEVEPFVKDIIYHEVWNMGGEKVVFFSARIQKVSVLIERYTPPPGDEFLLRLKSS